jgi:hypothetical protein
MALTYEEIIDFAQRYISQSEMQQFPFNGDLFCFLERDVAVNRIMKDDEGWRFLSYGICVNYEIETDTKPLGKWVWFSFMDLTSFPPRPQIIKLQPPHIVQGRFQNPERTKETRILYIGTRQQSPFGVNGQSDGSGKVLQEPKKNKTKILKFPSKS